MTHPKKKQKVKAVAYTLIPEQSDLGRPLYERLYALIDTHHEALARAIVRVALAWATSWKPDVDGRFTLGKCKKATELDRELAPYDFVILLNRDFWQNPNVTDTQRAALLDHELMHAAVAYDENGEPKMDERNRNVFRIRKHDLEEFADIASRYGCWKRDLEDFAQALVRAGDKSGPGVWVGYSALQRMLHAIGLDVDRDVIATWPDGERREVLDWAQIRAEAGEQANAATSETIPAVLAAALGVVKQEVVAHA
jgi:hypothetical protein